MGNIRIKSDRDGVYQPGEVVGIEKIIESYCECTNDKSLVNWIHNIPITSAIDFIAGAWGLEYEFV